MAERSRNSSFSHHERPDQTWGLTDCISFVVMEAQELTDTVTAARHFVQAGYRALMLDSSNS